jgi:hypothetical protein
MSSIKACALVLAAVFTAGTIYGAAAQERYHGIMIEEGGKPPPKKKGEPRKRPRGSSGYVAPTPLPRTEPIIVGPPSPGVYKPPPINSFSDRVNNCNHSFPLNAGIGNNPTDRNAYVRQCAN